MHDPVGIAVVGPGAVGSFLAAHLAAAGRDIVACARRPFDRYVVESDSLPASAPARVLVDPADAPIAALVLVCVKVTQTAGVAPWLTHLCGPETVVVSVQNGIESADLLRHHVPRGEVVPSVVYCGVELVGPGHVRHTTAARLAIPRSPYSAAVVDAFEPTAVRVDVTDDYVTESWRKLGINAAVNGITALTGRTTDVFQRSDVARLSLEVLQECWRVAGADGATLDDGLARVTIEGLVDRPIGAGTSMLYDRRAGRPTEHDAIYGAVARAADRLGLDAPLARAMQALLAAGDEPGIPTT